MTDNNQAEEHRLLKEENKILREQLDLKSKSISLSNSLTDEIKELLGVQSKRTTQEQNLLNLNKEINRQINNQKISASSVNEVQRQIAKNSNLIEKSIAQQNSLNKELSKEDKNRVQNIENFQKNLDKNEKELQRILDLSKEERDLQKDTIKELEKKIKQANDNIDLNLKDLSVNGRILLTTKLQTKELEKQNSEREKDAELLKKIEDSLGVAGKLSKLISKIPGLGNASAKALETVTSQLKKAADEGGKDLPNRMQTFKMLVKETGKNIKKDLTDPFVVGGFIISGMVKIFKFLKNALFEFSERTSQIARDLGISKDEAYGLSVNFQNISDSTQNILVNQKNLTASSKELNSIYGTNVIFTQKTLEGQINLVHRLGLQAEQAQKITQLGILNNKSQDEIISSITKQNKSLISNKKVIEEVAKASSLIFAQYKGSPDLIAKAVIQTQKLGLSLEQAQGISKSLLNFESSIASEMEAELLTGQQLNLEQARYLALMGDSAGAAAEVLKNLGPNGLNKFMNMNVIQQEALAGALGMSADQLATSLMTQQAMSRLTAEDRKGYEEAIAKAREQGDIDTVNALENLRNRGKSLELAKMELGAQQKFNLAVEKLKERFAKLFNEGGSGAKFIDKLTKLIDKIVSIPNLSGLLKIAGVLGVALTVGVLRASLLKGSTPMTAIWTKSVPGMGGGGGGGGMFGAAGRGRGGMSGNVGRAARAGRFLRGGGGLGLGLAGMGVSYLGEKAEEAGNESLGYGLGIGGSALEYAGMGAMIGTLAGPVGTAVGAGIGAIAGALMGYLREEEEDRDKKNEQIKTSLRDESLSSYRAMADGGIVTKPTKALVGEAGAEAVIPLKEFNNKLDQLINAVTAGNNIYIDGALLQKGMTLAAVKSGS